MAETVRVPSKAVIHYEGTDMPPVYVEGAQGMPTPQGSFHLSFYSEHVKPRETLDAIVTTSSAQPGSAQVQTGDVYGLDKEALHVVRRIEASLIITAPALRQVIPWLQHQLQTLERRG